MGAQVALIINHATGLSPLSRLSASSCLPQRGGGDWRQLRWTPTATLFNAQTATRALLFFSVLGDQCFADLQTWCGKQSLYYNFFCNQCKLAVFTFFCLSFFGSVRLPWLGIAHQDQQCKCSQICWLFAVFVALPICIILLANRQLKQCRQRIQSRRNSFLENTPPPSLSFCFHPHNALGRHWLSK